MILTVPHPVPLLEGRLVNRFDRFIADVRLGGEVVHTHCVNPGRMEGMVVPGARVWVSKAPPERRRKLRYTLELMELDGRLLGANTSAPNRIVEELLRAKALPGLRRYRALEREKRYAEGARVDFWLRQERRRAGQGRVEHFVEVKNCHLVYPDRRGYFPDSVSDRASRHLRELMGVVANGHRATVLFTVQTPEAEAIRPSDAHDPVFAETVREAERSGVRFRAVRVRPTLDAYLVEDELPVDTRPYDTSLVERHRAMNAGASGWHRRGPIE